MNRRCVLRLVLLAVVPAALCAWLGPLAASFYLFGAFASVPVCMDGGRES